LAIVIQEADVCWDNTSARQMMKADTVTILPHIDFHIPCYSLQDCSAAAYPATVAFEHMCLAHGWQMTCWQPAMSSLLDTLVNILFLGTYSMTHSMR
jgi:hypothetical protein